jgi:hypothetical protein
MGLDGWPTRRKHVHTNSTATMKLRLALDCSHRFVVPFCVCFSFIVTCSPLFLLVDDI